MDEYQIKKFIDQLSYEELKLYVRGFIEEEGEAGKQLVDYINLQLNKVGLHNAEVSVDSSFGKIMNRGDRWHYIPVTDWGHIESESHKLFDRANNALAAGQPDIALTIATRWLEDFADSYDDNEVYWFEEDNDVYFVEVCEKAEKIIDKAISHPNVSESVKKDISKRLNDLTSEGNPFSEYIDIYDLSARVNILCMSKEEALRALDERLEKYPSESSLIKQKYNLLLNMGRQLQAEEFIEGNLGKFSIADEYIEELLEAKRYEKLIPLLQKLTLPGIDNNPHFTPNHRWLQILANAQDALGLKEDASQTFRRLFVTTHGDLKYYSILKERIAPEKWSKFLDDTLERTDFSGYYGGGEQRYGTILRDEGRFKALHDWLKVKNDMEHYSYFLPSLPKDLCADLLPLFRDKIITNAERSKKRDEYTVLCKHIATIKGLPEGKPIALEIASLLKAKYKTRPAFMAELREVMGNVKY